MVKELICIVCPRGCHLTVDTGLRKRLIRETQ